MAGTRPGRAPVPDDVRQRRNAPAVEQRKIDAGEFPEYVDTHPQPPEPNEKWHPVARKIYDGLLKDPARMFMTSGDWALNMLMIENISRDMMPQVVGVIPPGPDGQPGDVVRDVVAMNGARMASVLKWASLVGLTDGARRSIGLHIKLGVTSHDLDGEPDGVVKKRADIVLLPPVDDE